MKENLRSKTVPSMYRVNFTNTTAIALSNVDPPMGRVALDCHRKREDGNNVLLATTNHWG